MKKFLNIPLKTYCILFFIIPVIIYSQSSLIYKTDKLEIEKLSENIYVHRSYIEYKGSQVACNGLVYISNGEAVVFDTSIDDSASVELINLIESEAKCRVIAIVVNHFHDDCLGGLKAFHSRGIESYSSELTRTLARNDTKNKPEIPKNGFENELIMKVGSETVTNRYFGEAHTKDNIISYIPAENIMFGGCMIKELNAGKGNLNDANLKEWSNTVTKVKSAYPDVKIVVPGHGDYGDSSLLDYTIKLFESYR